ncbi:MAG: GNAT family N-acetyltransferase [Mesorhizobium sp.]|uniref:GNAT family N-acetyltransferase n=1 Tax=Mesorhizobium sp. TaxID=1871066 RepID=UPI000FE7FAD7|nr:GNAT family N-acetyltransferase [Mesorhizobium sp.]RWM96612.1 MAG: GNAT family N-acetyltransferase [Mesorhizobium sp.]
MISVSPARSAEDFETVAGLCRKLAQWDVDAVAPYGVSAEDVKAIFHPETSGSELANKFGAPDAMACIARSESLPAGCLAFDQFDDHTAELHKFFVDESFRGKGIGRALMGTAMAEIAKRRSRRVLIHTTFYMTNAIAVYESFGFKLCPPFRETPEHVRHTDIFMSCSISPL